MHLGRTVRVRLNWGLFAAAAATAALAAACGGSTTTLTEVSGPTAARCQASIANTPPTVPHSGSRLTLNVVAERECAWTAASEASWAQVAPATGQGQGAVSVTVASNPDASERSAAIVINDMRLSVRQEAAPCRFQLGTTRSVVSHEGGRVTVSVAAPNGCAWRANSGSAWARVLTASGSGSGAVEIEVSQNTGLATRTAAIAIADATMTIEQEGRGTELPPPSPTPPPPGGGTGGGGGGTGGEQRVELSGRAFLVDGSCPSISFLLEFRRVFTNGDTRFRGGNCRNIRNGSELSVEGRLQSDGRVRAVEVSLRDDDDD